MSITKDAKLFSIFEKSYWNYYLELEEQFLSTKRYVAFDKANFKTFSMEYLKLLEAVCSEIDVVGKEIAHQIDPTFKINDSSSNIQKWWYAIQSWFFEHDPQPVKMLDEMVFNPWAGYEIVQQRNKKGVNYLKLKNGCCTPSWWTAYARQPKAYLQSKEGAQW